MSLVTTTRDRVSANWVQSNAISELFPVPTGPATPTRKARFGASVEVVDGVAAAGGVVDGEVAIGGVVDGEVAAGGVVEGEAAIGGVVEGEVAAGGVAEREVADCDSGMEQSFWFQSVGGGPSLDLGSGWGWNLIRLVQVRQLVG
jgi:hypothetical protein